MSRTIRPLLVRCAIAVVSAAALVCVASTAQARPSPSAPPSHTAPVAATGIDLSSPSDTGASDTSNLGSGGWAVQSSAVATQTGAQISTPGFSTSTWLPVSNDDAGAPGTEIEALAQNGKCPGDTALQPANQGSSSPNSVFSSSKRELCSDVMDPNVP